MAQAPGSMKPNMSLDDIKNNYESQIAPIIDRQMQTYE
jgi:hypothetical protein